MRGGFDFSLDLLHLALIGGVGVGRLAQEVAGNVVLLDAVGHQFEGGLVGLRIELGGFGVKAALEVVVDQVVKGGNLGRGVGRNALDDVVGLDDGDALAFLLEEQGRGQAGDAATDHGHVDGGVAGHRFVVGVLGRGKPIGLVVADVGAVNRAAHFGLVFWYHACPPVNVSLAREVAVRHVARYRWSHKERARFWVRREGE